MQNIYSRLIPAPTYGKFHLPFTCDCGEEHMVTIKVTNEEGFEYLQQRCNHCKDLLRVYAINGTHKGKIFPGFVYYSIADFKEVLAERKVKAVCRYFTNLTLNEWFNGELGKEGKSAKVLRDLKSRKYTEPVQFDVTNIGMKCRQEYNKEGFKGISAIPFKESTYVASSLNYFFISTYSNFIRTIIVIELE